jgi:hypothetical protein
LHYAALVEQDVIRTSHLSKITTPWKTAKDCFESCLVPDEFLIDTYLRARKGFLIPSQAIRGENRDLSPEGRAFFERIEQKFTKAVG